MKFKKICLLSLLIGFNLQALAQEYVPKEIILKVKNSKDLLLNFSEKTLEIDAFNDLVQIKEITPIGNFNKTNTLLIKYETAVDDKTILEVVKNNKSIAFAELNYLASGAGVKYEEAYYSAPSDQLYPYQWGLKNNGNYTNHTMEVVVNADAKVESAWDIATGSEQMTIAVIDTGFFLDHPDFSGRTWINNLEIPNNGIDDDNNGYIDDVYGWDFVNQDNMPLDDHGHGTNCASIIGATSDNNIGISGVNWNSKIMNLKALNSNNSGSYANMANSLYYAADNGAKIISMSIGGLASSQTITNAISYLNNHDVLLVVCMMNTNNSDVYYPAGHSLTHNNVIAVGASDANDHRTSPFFWSETSGSNYGSHINLIAPGNYIWGLGNTSNNLYNYWGGTSQATPLVAGIASLILEVNPNLTPSEIRSLLQNTADDQVGLPTEDVLGFDIYYGYGRVNAYNALIAATNTLSNNHVAMRTKEIKILNPVKNKNIKILSYDFPNESFDYELYSWDGKLIKSNTINFVENEFNLEVADIKSGNYIIKIQNNNFKKIFKLNIE